MNNIEPDTLLSHDGQTKTAAAWAQLDSHATRISREAAFENIRTAVRAGRIYKVVDSAENDH